AFHLVKLVPSSAVDSLGRALHQSDISIVEVLSTGAKKWIQLMHHSIIYWVGEHAVAFHHSRHLPLHDRACFTWLGQRGSCWDMFIPFWGQVKAQGPLDLLLLQIEENDLTSQKSLGLVLSMKSSLEFIPDFYPTVHIIWSNLLKRRVWQGVYNPKH
ncbi:hypothetical protein JRQ81_017586, partial [Phrynocephalus forsythii]